MTTDRERKERKESLKELFLLLHNCAAEYQSQDIAKIHYSHLARAAGEINALLYENEALRKRNEVLCRKLWKATEILEGVP